METAPLPISIRALHRQRRAGAGALLTMFAVLGLILLSRDPESRAVLLPVFASAFALTWFILRLQHLSGTTPIAEVGAWYAVVGAVYCWLPLLVYLGLGMVFVPTSDGRLFAIQPDPFDVARIGWMYVVHIAAFQLTYASLRRYEPSARQPMLPVRARTVKVALLISISLTLFLSALRFLMPTPENYAGTYAAVAAMPLAVRQALKFLNGVNFVLIIVILVAGFQDYKRWRGLIILWLLFQLISTLTAGARTGLVLAFSAYVILYHTMVKPIRTKTTLLLGSISLIAFLGLGVLRNYQGAERRADFTFALSGGEFESLFANAVDIDRRRSSDEIEGAPPGAYLADFIAPIPSQLLPFEKLDLAEWYVSRFYPAAKEEGHGYAFGVIAQAVLGYGWIELALRGVFLAMIFAALHRFYSRQRHRLWVVVFYVWLIVTCYQSFRGTSLSLWTAFVQQFLPTLVIIEGLGGLLAKASSYRRASNTSGISTSEPGFSV